MLWPNQHWTKKSSLRPRTFKHTGSIELGVSIGKSYSNPIFIEYSVQLSSSDKVREKIYFLGVLINVE